MRKTTSLTLALTIATAVLISPLQAEDKSKPASVESETPHIQLAILLDTSGSMDGLINQARTQLWKIVNELATAEQNGKTSQLQVALYEYGKQTIAAKDNYLREIVPLTDDLDKISEELFALKTNGGEEYCGAVIDHAVRNLKWSESNDDLKMIFICGNEAFTQGKIDYRKACSNAIAKGITISTIFCGNEQEGVNTKWKHGADLADGSFLNINQNAAVAQIKTPFDQKLANLSSEVNRTYLFIGDKKTRDASKRRQIVADQAAQQAAPAAAANRANFKASKQYGGKADLISSLEKKQVELEELKEEELPEELKKLNTAERKKYIGEKAKQRTEIQKQIKELSVKRDAFIQEQRKKNAESDTDTLDTAVIKALQDQAKKKQFQLKN